MTPEDLRSLVEFEKSIQWMWSSGDPAGYMDALAEDVVYVDPLARRFLVGKEEVREHFHNIHGDAGITRQEYWDEIARPIGEREGLLTFSFNTYQEENNKEKLFLSWNMSLIFRKAENDWLMTYGHLSLRKAWFPETIPALRDSWLQDGPRE